MTKKPNHAAAAGTEETSFEQHLGRLEQIVQQLETGQMDLSAALKVFEEGLEHLRHCHAKLREAEERIALVVQVDADGTARLKEFTEENATAEQQPPRTKRSTQGESPERLF